MSNSPDTNAAIFFIPQDTRRIDSSSSQSSSLTSSSSTSSLAREIVLSRLIHISLFSVHHPLNRGSISTSTSNDILFSEPSLRRFYPVVICLLIATTLFLLSNTQPTATADFSFLDKSGGIRSHDDAYFNEIHLGTLNSTFQTDFVGLKKPRLVSQTEWSSSFLDETTGEIDDQVSGSIDAFNSNDDNQSHSISSRSEDSGLSEIAFPSASFTLKGRYRSFLLNSENSEGNLKTFNGKSIDTGSFRLVLLSKPAVIKSVRLTSLKIDLKSDIFRNSKTLVLSGNITKCVFNQIHVSLIFLFFCLFFFSLAIVTIFRS